MMNNANLLNEDELDAVIGGSILDKFNEFVIDTIVDILIPDTSKK